MVAGLGAGVGAAPMWAYHHQWIGDVAAAGFPLLVAYLSLWSALFVWVGVGAAWALRGVRVGFARSAAIGLVLALVWAGLEWWRGEVVLTGYAWFFVGHPLIEFAGGRGLAGVAGAPGVTLMVAGVGVGLALVAAGVARRAERRGRLVVGLGMVVVTSAVFAAGVGLERGYTRGEGSGGVRVGVVQTNVPQLSKSDWTVSSRIDDFVDFARMTERAGFAEGGPADVVVWPETMFPGNGLDPEVTATQREAGYTLQELDEDGAVRTRVRVATFADELLGFQRELGVPMLIGAIGFEGYELGEGEGGGVRVGYEALFNSVFLVRGGEVDEGRYDKMRLTPFGEEMPYVQRWRWLVDRLATLGARRMSFDLSRGREAVVFEIETEEGGGVGVATPICFELTSFGVCRRLVFDESGGRRAGLMVHVTNDGWFGGFGAGKEHHLMQARWRAAELRTPVVRAANTGVSAHIDALGRVVERGVDETFSGWRSGADVAAFGGEDRVGDDVAGVLRVRVDPGFGEPASLFFGPAIGVVSGVVALGGVVCGVIGLFGGGRRRVDRGDAEVTDG